MGYIGVDLHSDRFTCNFDGNNNVIIETYALEDSIMERFYQRISKEDYVVLEASTNSFEFYDRIREKVKEVYIVNPKKMRIISDTSKKTDKVDAVKLRKLLKYHVENDNEFLPMVYVPEEEIRELRGLFTTYKLYKKQIGQMKNRIHSLIKQSLNGYRYKGREIGEELIEEVMNDEKVKRIYREQIKVIYETVKIMEEKVKEIKGNILWTGREHKKDIEILTTVNGISVFIAIGLIADYGKIERFKNAKQFTSYLRSVPKVDGSNKRIYVGKTKKEGRRLTISLLTQSLYHVISKQSILRDFYIKKQKGKSKGKVRMAVVRKLLVAIYYMLRDRKYYRYMDEKNHKRKMKEYERFLKRYEKNLKK